jgi:hypothetical protein
MLPPLPVPPALAEIKLRSRVKIRSFTCNLILPPSPDVVEQKVERSPYP